MTCRRYSRALLFLALLVAVSSGGLLLFARPHRIDVAHSLLVQEGMSEAEVEEILGVPAGDYDGYEKHGGFCAFSVVGLGAGDVPKVKKTWTSRRGSIEVEFATRPDGWRVERWEWWRSQPRSLLARWLEEHFGPFGQFHPRHGGGDFTVE
jgi:hypothetical protein